MTARRVLIAGIGNIFLGDDAFGVEVVRRLSLRPLPPGVVVRDFGIRGFDLACALQEGYDAVILVDACPRGGYPGTLQVIEPTVDESESVAAVARVEMHHLDPLRVFQLSRDLGGPLPCLCLIGCEPATLEPDGETIPRLSEPVQAAVSRAVALAEALAADLLTREGRPDDEHT
jgi:hydrogenase maturation protease